MPAPGIRPAAEGEARAVPPPTEAHLAVLAVHGNGGGAVRFAGAARAAPAGIAIHAVDLPGFDGRPLDPACRTIADHAALVALAVARLPRPRVLLGHGIGGSLVLEALQQRPDLADGVILHAPVGADLERRLFPRLMRPRPMRELVRRLLAARALRGLWARRLFRRRPDAATLEAFFAGYRRCAAFAAPFDWITPAWFAALRPVDVPAILWWGGRERVLRPAQAAAFQRVLPRAEIVVEAEWDHFPMLEDPAEYATRLAALAARLTAVLATTERPA